MDYPVSPVRDDQGSNAKIGWIYCPKRPDAITTVTVRLLMAVSQHSHCIFRDALRGKNKGGLEKKAPSLPSTTNWVSRRPIDMEVGRLRCCPVLDTGQSNDRRIQMMLDPPYRR